MPLTNAYAGALSYIVLNYSLVKGMEMDSLYTEERKVVWMMYFLIEILSNYL